MKTCFDTKYVFYGRRKSSQQCSELIWWGAFSYFWHGWTDAAVNAGSCPQHVHSYVVVFILLWEFSFELLKNNSHWCKLKGWCGKYTLYQVAVCCPVLVYCSSNKFWILFFEEALCFWLHWETVLYLCLLETDCFKGYLTKKRVLLCSAWQKDTNWQIERLLPEVAIFL